MLYTLTVSVCVCRFGGFLIQQEIIQTGDMLAVFFAVLIGAFALGQATPNVESILTAAGAAFQIFETIDRVREPYYCNVHVHVLLYMYCYRYLLLTLVLMKVLFLIN